MSPGVFPPPPLNGSAHTWHHDKDMLLQMIAGGGEPFGGIMPAFRDSLALDERIAVLAFIQSHWSDSIYRNWTVRSENAAR